MRGLQQQSLFLWVHAGINAVLFYVPVIFTALGASQQAALLSAVAVRCSQQAYSRMLCSGINAFRSCGAARHSRQVQQEREWQEQKFCDIDS